MTRWDRGRPVIRRPRPRTLGSSVRRVLVPRLVAFAAAVATFSVGQALGPVPAAELSAVPADEGVDRTPRWTLHDAATYPGCVPSAAWPAGAPAPYVVVRDAAGEGRKMTFDRAWRVSHNRAATDDVWVVGVCGGTTGG